MLGQEPGEWRSLAIRRVDGDAFLVISARYPCKVELLLDLQAERAVPVCGQMHALILTERFLDRGNFGLPHDTPATLPASTATLTN
jgi:hypothetical protein